MKRDGKIFKLIPVILGLVLFVEIGYINHAEAQFDPIYSIPIRWCVIGDDANGNGVFDGDELGGAPAFTDPGNVGETDTDNVLWRRHERISDGRFIPQAGITLRSALQNIVEDPNLNFPIIPDPDTSDPDHQYGDILNPQIDDDESDAAYNACVDAWGEDYEDIGIVAVVARKVVDEDGDEDAFAVGWLNGARKVLLEDNAWSLPGSGLMTSAVGDPVDKTFGHEVGHTMPTDSPSDGIDLGLRHVCSSSQGGQDDNIMRNGRIDLDSDDLLDNSNLSDSVAHVTDKGDDDSECTGDDTDTVIDQIALLREAAPLVPGCKILEDGPDSDCTLLSDVKTDLLGEVSEKYLDISMVFATETDTGMTMFTHELFDPISNEAITLFSDLTYYVIADLDNNPSTGGSPSDLGIPSNFVGAELITKVNVSPIIILGFLELEGPPASNIDETVWKFDGGSFEEVSDPSINAFIDRRVAHVHEDDGGEEFPTSDAVVIEFSNDVRGPANVPFRIQALSVGLPTPGPFSSPSDEIVMDLLDDSIEEEGFDMRLVAPVFPECEVFPDTVLPSDSVEVEASGLLSDSGIHVLFGPDLVAEGVSDGSGNFSTEFMVPSGASGGLHLVTVGVDGTGLTADCFIEVRDSAVSGEFLPSDYTALFLAGLSQSAVWMVPTILGIAGAGVILRHKLHRD